jgi:hypothetical protein
MSGESYDIENQLTIQVGKNDRQAIYEITCAYMYIKIYALINEEKARAVHFITKYNLTGLLKKYILINDLHQSLRVTFNITFVVLMCSIVMQIIAVAMVNTWIMYVLNIVMSVTIVSVCGAKYLRIKLTIGKHVYLFITICEYIILYHQHDFNTAETMALCVVVFNLMLYQSFRLIKFIKFIILLCQI